MSTSRRSDTPEKSGGEKPIPKVSILITNYNGSVFILPCLESLAEQSFRDFEIIFIDNNSTDDSLIKANEVIKELSFKFPISIITLHKNLGFTGGNTEGFRSSRAEYIALLNNDTEVDRIWLQEFVNTMDSNPEVGICASKLLIYGTQTIDSAGDGYATTLKGYKRGEGESSGKYRNDEFIFGACAGAALYRRKMLDEIGFFDEDFFLIHEDTDLNLRAQLSGWKVKYVPSAVVHHKVRSTIGHMSDIAVYYTLRNSEFVRIKNIPLPVFFRYLPEYLLGQIFEFFYFGIKHRKVHLYLKAKRDVLMSFRRMMKKRKEVMKLKKVENAYLCSMMTSFWSKEFFSTKVKKFILR